MERRHRLPGWASGEVPSFSPEGRARRALSRRSPQEDPYMGKTLHSGSWTENEWWGVVVHRRSGGDEDRYEIVDPAQHRGRGRWGIHGGPWFLTCRCAQTGRGPGLGEITHLALDVWS